MPGETVLKRLTPSVCLMSIADAGSRVGEIREILKKDGLVIYPTDTLYGLGGNFYSYTVIQKIDRFKHRQDQPYSIAVSGMDMLKSLVAEIPEVFYQSLRSLVPGPFTFLFPTHPDLDPGLLKGQSKIGIRIPGHPQLLEWIEATQLPWITTSVNVSGQASFNDPVSIRQAFFPDGKSSELDLFIDAGPLPPSPGSTILDLSQTPVRVIRIGDGYDRFLKLGIPFQSNF